MNFYNEHDPKAAAWLRELIRAGLIPDGTVDERSIVDIEPADLDSFVQCHFFAGIGGWSYALQLAGWPADKPVWTGSCPCQPFSAAGRKWLAGVSADLEALAYSCAAADLCAACVGAPHIRQRIYWMGVADGAGRFARQSSAKAAGHGNSVISTSGDGWVGHARCFGDESERERRKCNDETENMRRETQKQRLRIEASNRSEASGSGERSSADGLALAGHGAGCAEQRLELPQCDSRTWKSGEVSGVVGIPNSQSERFNRIETTSEPDRRSIIETSGGLGDNSHAGLQGHGRLEQVSVPKRGEDEKRHGATTGFWSDYDIIPFKDGKHRRIEPGTFPLAHGFPARVAILKGFGNAIVPQCAEAFIRSGEEALTTL